MIRKALAWCLLLAVSGIVVIATYRLIVQQRHIASLSLKMAQIVPVVNQIEVSCAGIAAARPLVLLALGQSNAGNHGSLPPITITEPVTLFAEGKCIKTTDPLPGGTGTGGSIWGRLPDLLSKQKDDRQIVLSVLAVDATSIEDWTSPESQLRERLSLHVASMIHLGLAPNFVLWQQGEADSRIGTSTEVYSIGLNRLATTLNKAGANAPIILARSTVCRSPPNTTIRSIIETTVSYGHGFHLGPDTDILSSDMRKDGCHLTAEGLDSAAKMWAKIINKEISMIYFPQ